MKRFLTTTAVLAIALSACGDDQDNPSAKSTALALIPPSANPNGKTYTEWSTAWWKWYYESPVEPSCNTAIADTTGERCTANQSGDVWFLVGGSGGTILRTKCAIPAGKSLFFPILNFATDNAGVPLDQHIDEATMQRNAAASVDTATSLILELDGVKVENTAQLRVAPTRFTYTLPGEPNAYTCLGAPGVVGLVDPSYSAGVYAFVGPISAGKHTVHFAGTSGTFSLDITYELTVQ